MNSENHTLIFTNIFHHEINYNSYNYGMSLFYFRLSPDHLSHDLLRSCEPDILYLDNTYNNPLCVFPSRVSKYTIHMLCTEDI